MLVLVLAEMLAQNNYTSTNTNTTTHYMPELPEVETVRTGLDAALRGKTVARVQLARADLRFPFPPGFAKKLEGSKILRIERRAKYLLFRLSGGGVWLSHLGMSGNFSFQKKAQSPQKHDHVVITFADKTLLVFNDPRRFGFMDFMAEEEVETHKLLAGIGPEPLGNGFSPAYLEEQLSARKTPVKVALMDQSLVAGVGNIYASEALYLAKLDPRLPAHRAAPFSAELVTSIRRALEAAIASGGSSLRDFVHIGGETGYFQHRFQVYGREGEPCFSCTAAIRQLRQGGRATFWCPTCQPNPSKTAHLRPRKKMAKGA